MKNILSDSSSKNLAAERLTALWALSESGFGGMMHAMQLPFKGVVIGGIAVIIITLIGHIADNKFKAILKATLIVLIIKAIVSPHTPPTAYFAVAFQGLTGAIIFRTVGNVRVAALSLSMIAFVESALQRLIVLTIIFGNPLWESINVFFDYILRESGLIGLQFTANASWWLIGFYMAIYLVSGFLIGVFSGNLPKNLSRSYEIIIDRGPIKDTEVAALAEFSGKRQKKWWQKHSIRILGTLILITLILYFLTPEGSWTRGIYIFIRSFLIIGIWYFLLAPLVIRLMKKFLDRQQSRYSRDVEQVLITLPYFKKAAGDAWIKSAGYQGLGRLKQFILFLFSEILYRYPVEDPNWSERSGSK